MFCVGFIFISCLFSPAAKLQYSQ